MKRIFAGDVNFDGKITRIDADLVCGHVSATKLLTGDALIAADVNGDGAITAEDYKAIENHALGLAIITNIIYKEEETNE